MLQISLRSWFTAIWALAIVVVSSLLSSYVSTVGLMAVAVIGIAPLVVLLLLARHPAQTTAEAIRAAITGRSDR